MGVPHSLGQPYVLGHFREPFTAALAFYKVNQQRLGGASLDAVYEIDGPA